VQNPMDVIFGIIRFESMSTSFYWIYQDLVEEPYYILDQIELLLISRG
jgi:hypothetical protein